MWLEPHPAFVERARSGHRALTPGLSSSLWGGGGGGGCPPCLPFCSSVPCLLPAIIFQARRRPAQSSCLLPPESYFSKGWLPSGPVFLPQAGQEEAKNNPS